jgi:hypothetical protein
MGAVRLLPGSAFPRRRRAELGVDGSEAVFVPEPAWRRGALQR